MTPLDRLEDRRLFSLFPGPMFDLQADSDRNGVIDSRDELNEDRFTTGSGGRGALVLPNLDRDGSGPTPDNWAGGVWNGRVVPANNVIDNRADLADIGRVRLRKLGFEFTNYELVLRVIRPATDTAALRNVDPQNRVRIFIPSLVSGPNHLLQPGDAALIGPGLGDSIRFVAEPAAPNELSSRLLEGDGYLELGIEGLRLGAGVRLELQARFYNPLFGDPNEPFTRRDLVALRVAPFVLTDHRRSIDSATIEQLDQFGTTNKPLRDQLKSVFNDRLQITRTGGDPWQQDTHEIGYVQTPYGSMPVVLELPRSRLVFRENSPSLIRSALLKPGVGVSTELSMFPLNSSSASGGDIESLPIPGKPDAPGFLLRSREMPEFLKSFFDTQGVNPALELTVDDWLSVGHVDEVVSLSGNGRNVVMPDAELAWALLLWAGKLNRSARMLAGVSGLEVAPSYNASGVPISVLLDNAALRTVNLERVSKLSNLPAAVRTIRDALGLTEDVSTPRGDSTNRGNVRLLRGGAFTSLLGNIRREFEVKLGQGNSYQLRYSDRAGVWSSWLSGSRDRDEVFETAGAYILTSQWQGRSSVAGDTFRFATNPSATLNRVPVLFANSSVRFDPTGGAANSSFLDLGRVRALTMNHVNSLVSGSTIVTGETFGPRVNHSGNGASDILKDYVRNTFQRAGYTNVVFADGRWYHNSGGNIHCGTNVTRRLPTTNWWETVSSPVV
jgi:hypothetical protein